MKKILLVSFILIACVVMFGCGKKEKNKDWETLFSSYKTNMSEEDMNIFKNATKEYKKMKLEVVALLGEQVVAGTNLMYLAKGYKDDESEAEYKIVIVYNNLEGKSKVTNVEEFDYTKYVNKEINGTQKALSGGWYVNIPENEITLDDEVQSIFENATSNLTGVYYTPIVTLGKKKGSLNNYAVLCYGRGIYYSSNRY